MPEEVYASYRARAAELSELSAKWDALFAAYEKAFPEKAAEYKACMKGNLPDFENDPEFWNYSGKAATRATSGKALNYVASKLPNFFGRARPTSRPPTSPT